MKVTLKEHIERIFEEKDRALSAALISLNDRLKLLNELRNDVATKAQVKALENQIADLKTRVDKNEGRGIGIQQFIGWILAAIAIIAFAIKYR